MATLSNELRKRVTVRGKIPRGALSRIGEHVGVSPSTVRRWIKRMGVPSVHCVPALRRFLDDAAVDLSAVKPGPKRDSGKKSVS